MENKTYLNWVSEKSKTSWWHDSADPSELRDALGMGACGITTNPMLVKATLLTSQNEWKGKINTEELLGMDSSERARYLTFEVVKENAKSIEQLHKLNPHRDGYICAQVDPSLCGSRGEMIAMAIELARSGVRVNSVSPGSTLTEGTKKLFYGEGGSFSDMAKTLLASIPQSRPGSADEMGDAAAFLASDAAKYITGHNLVVDGGWLAGYHRDF